MPNALSSPQHPFPRGWFQIGRSHELLAGDVRAVKYFGKDLVLFRNESGEVGLLDAHCQHLGAHLGVGGKVNGDSVQCPWHGWCWDTKGRNTAIPYSVEDCKPNVRVGDWHVREWYGNIVAWNDWEPGGEPYWEPPKIPELEGDDFYSLHNEYSDHLWKVKCHPQMPLENAVDFAHIEYVHGHTDPPELVEVRSKDHWIRFDVAVEYGRGKKSTWLTPGGPVESMMEIEGFGIGFGTVRFPGIWPTVMVTSITPIDENYSAYYFQQASKRGEGETGDLPEGMAKAMIDLQVGVIPQDFPIWENMEYLENPNPAREEGKDLLQLRSWCAQFYPPSVGDVPPVNASRA